MIKHAMTIIKDAIEHLIPGQIPVVTMDQPLYNLVKQIQWIWPQLSEENFVVMLDGLHIEMAAQKHVWYRSCLTFTAESS